MHNNSTFYKPPSFARILGAPFSLVYHFRCHITALIAIGIATIIATSISIAITTSGLIFGCGRVHLASPNAAGCVGDQLLRMLPQPLHGSKEGRETTEGDGRQRKYLNSGALPTLRARASGSLCMNTRRIRTAARAMSEVKADGDDSWQSLKYRPPQPTSSGLVATKVDVAAPF